jgi:hypothetical protein
MSKRRDALVGVVIAAALAGSFALEGRQPTTSHAGALRDLFASPACLRADGRPRPGGPSVAAAWMRATHRPIGQAEHTFVSAGTITLRVAPNAGMGEITFIAVGAHRWRPNNDLATSAWVARICGAAR